MIEKLALQNFRNFSEKVLSFNSLTALVGPNGIGKTNILEAITLLSTGKGIYSSKVDEMIEIGKKISRVKAKIAANEGKETLEVVLTNGFLEEGGIVKKTQKRKLLVDDTPKRSVDFASHLKTVLFTPRDLDIIVGSPSLRRNFLDTLLSQIDREYRRSLSSYEKGLRSRNKLLWKLREFGLPAQAGGSRSVLYFWDKLIIKNGQYITAKRQEFIDYLNCHTALGDMNYKVIYDLSIISENRLEQYAREEVAAAVTLVGPHRDDFELLVRVEDKEKNLAKFGSRGEQRMGVLWLKLSELEYISSFGERPVLLLDDIFSELDHKHRNIVMEVCRSQQTIMTTADEHYIGEFSNIDKIELKL